MEVSTLSPFEMANLIGSYYNIIQKDSIDPRLLERGYTPEQIKALNETVVKKNPTITCSGVLIKGDLKQFKEPSLNFYISSFYAYDNHGTLPFDGPYSKQPSKIFDIFDILSQIKFDEEERSRIKHEREQSRKK
ncbi:hypothetical protein KAR91_80575 [Candidatus Pacearchaeota archaeon]|nr:hypothetical protein [Candidatus Pacearchaeota archaeon]